MRNLLFSLFGQTNTGKSHLCDFLRKREHIGLIEIGREMRRRHPPEYFEGKGAMDKTEAEVWRIVDEARVRNAGKQVIVIDGQPRLKRQVDELRDRFGPFAMIWLHAPDSVLRDRAIKRAAGDRAQLKLSLDRMVNDRVQLFEVLHEYTCARFPLPLISVDTCGNEWESYVLQQIRRTTAQVKAKELKV